jgi:hypothetical protein
MKILGDSYFKVGLAVVCLIVALIVEYITLDNRQKTLNEFPGVSKNKEFYGKIKKIRIDRSVARLELEDGEKLTVDARYNDLYEPHSIKDFLNIGDLIKKNLNSDTIFIERNENVFYFLIW